MYFNDYQAYRKVVSFFNGEDDYDPARARETLESIFDTAARDWVWKHLSPFQRKQMYKGVK